MFPKYTKIALITLAALIVNMAIALNAHAQYSQIYAEISYGQIELDSFEQFPSYSDFGEQSGKDDAVGISVGRRFNDNLAVEIGYFDFGSFQSEVTALFPRFQYGDDEIFVGLVPSVPDYSQIKISSVQISLVGSIDWGQRFSFFVKGGISQGYTRIKVVDNNLLLLKNPNIPDTVGNTSSASESGSGLYLGAGVLVNFTRTFSMEIEYQSYNISNSLFSDNLSLQATTLGLRYKF